MRLVQLIGVNQLTMHDWQNTIKERVMAIEGRRLIMNNRQVLRGLLKSEKLLVMPDAYDALSARLIQLAGFKAGQCSGFSMGLASLAAEEQERSNRNRRGGICLYFK